MSEAKITVEVLKNLREKIEPYLSRTLRESQFFVDLADIHEICRSYSKAIDGLLTSSNDKESIENILRDIDNELLEHLPNHIKSLKKLLPRVINEIKEKD